MSANLTNNNKYYNLSAQSLKLNDLDVQQQLNDLQNEINNLSNNNSWTNTNGGSVPISSGLVLTTDGIEDGAVANEQIEITETFINLKNNVSVYDDLYCNKNLNIQSDTSQTVSMFVDISNNFKISNLNNSRMIFQNSSNYEFDNNIISNENVILNQGKSLTLNNDTDADNIKLYKLNGLNGNFVLDNQSGTRTTFKNAKDYTFDNDVLIGTALTTKKLFLNNVEIKLPVKFLNNYYVSSSGTNALGDGSISNPWGTIGHAVSVLSAIVGDIQATINIAAGTYNENLTINKSGIALVGASSNLPNLTIINGNITFDMNVGSGLFSAGGLENVQLNGILEQRQSNIYTNALNVTNCILFGQSTKNMIITSGSGGGLLASMTIQASLIYMSDAIAVAIDNTAISMINTQLTNSPLLAVSPTSFITVGGAGRINLFGCSIFQGSAVSTVDPLILVNNSSTVTSSSQINSCILVYTSSTSDAGTGNKACIKFSGSAAMNTYTLVYNYFRCVGAQTGSPNNQCVQRTGTAQLAVIIGNNIAGSPAHHVAPASGSYTKTTLLDVI